jgi:hypothetical protein
LLHQQVLALGQDHQLEHLFLCGFGLAGVLDTKEQLPAMAAAVEECTPKECIFCLILLETNHILLGLAERVLLRAAET